MVGKTLGVIVGALGAVAGSQAPAFTTQYMQNLSGRVAELRPIVEQFDADAAGYGLSREEGLEEYEGSEGFVGSQGGRAAETIRRYEKLAAHLEKLQSAGGMERPLTLLQNFDPEIVEATFELFDPAVPTTTEGAAYAGGGFASIWAIFSGLWASLSQLGGGRRRYA